MKRVIIIGLIGCGVLGGVLGGCAKGIDTQAETDKTMPRAVQTATVQRGRIEREWVYPGVAVYRNKPAIAAPMSGYVVETCVQVGEHVRKGQVLFRIESKEQHAVADTLQAPIAIRATQDGVMLSVVQQAGSYVAEGSTLGQMAEARSMVFEVSVPSEEAAAAQGRCTLLLPDGRQVAAMAGEALAEMDATTQTVRIVVRAENTIVPEGMEVQAVFREPQRKEAALVPRRAVESSEQMTRYRVYVQDSTGIRPVEVRLGNGNDSVVEVVSPHLSECTKIQILR